MIFELFQKARQLAIVISASFWKYSVMLFIHWLPLTGLTKFFSFFCYSALILIKKRKQKQRDAKIFVKMQHKYLFQCDFKKGIFIGLWLSVFAPRGCCLKSYPTSQIDPTRFGLWSKTIDFPNLSCNSNPHHYFARALARSLVYFSFFVDLTCSTDALLAV